MNGLLISDRVHLLHQEVQTGRRNPFTIKEVACSGNPILYLMGVGEILCGQALFVTEDTMSAIACTNALQQCRLSAGSLVDLRGNIDDGILGAFLLMKFSYLVAPASVLEGLPGFSRINTVHYMYVQPSVALADRLLDGASNASYAKCSNLNCPNACAAIFYHIRSNDPLTTVRHVFPW